MSLSQGVASRLARNMAQFSSIFLVLHGIRNGSGEWNIAANILDMLGTQWHNMPLNCGHKAAHKHPWNAYGAT